MSDELLIVSPATTAGWRTEERELVAALGRLGVAHRVERIRLGRGAALRRFQPAIDLVEARGARRALSAGLRAGRPRAVLLITSTAALLAPLARLRREGIEVAVKLDCPAAVNRPGAPGALQRALERRRLAAASLVVATGPRSAEMVAGLAARVAVVPIPIEIGDSPAVPASPPYLVAYAANPAKKGLDTICRAWAKLGGRRDGAALRVTGIEAGPARRFLAARGVPELAGVAWEGLLDPPRYRELLTGASAFLAAPRIEDYGVAQLEALALGVPLVTTTARGAYEAEPLARELAPELVAPADDPGALAAAIEAALALSSDDGRRRAYAIRAAALTVPFGREAAEATLRDEVLPALGF